MSSIESDHSLAMQMVDVISKLCPEIVLSCDSRMFYVKQLMLCHLNLIPSFCFV